MTTTAAAVFDPEAWPADPSAEEVRALAARLAQLIPLGYQPPKAETARLLDQAHTALTALAEGKDLTTHAEAVADALERLRGHAYHRPLGDVANCLVPGGCQLVRTARQAAAGGCRLGGKGPCEGTGRVTVWVYDDLASEQDPGCPVHAAQEAQKWDHGRSVEVYLVGPPEACQATRAHLAGLMSPLPRWSTTPPRTT